MVDDAIDELITEIRRLRETMGGGTDVSVSGGTGGGGGGSSASQAVAEGGTLQSNVDVAVPGEGGPLTDVSPVFTTGPRGAEITSREFTSEGEFVFGFPARVVDIQFVGDPVTVAFDGENIPSRQTPIVPTDLYQDELPYGRLTLGSGSTPFRTEKVNIKLARMPGMGMAEGSTIHIFAYR